MHGRICCILCAAMLALLTPAFAQTQSAVAATAASSCSQFSAVSNHRSLSSVHSSTVRRKCERVRKSQNVVRFFHNHRLLMAPRYFRCWNLPDKEWRERVCHARAIVRKNQARLSRLYDQIDNLIEAELVVGNVSAWLCIHGYEGSWSDPNGPYYGGLQMDWNFMSSYGPPVLGFKNFEELRRIKGTADHWTPREQMAVAEYARSGGRGYYPWPNTARMCGLI